MGSPPGPVAGGSPRFDPKVPHLSRYFPPVFTSRRRASRARLNVRVRDCAMYICVRLYAENKTIDYRTFGMLPNPMQYA